MNPKSPFEFVPRDTKESEFLDLVDFGGVAFSVESVVSISTRGQRHLAYYARHLHAYLRACVIQGGVES